MTDIGLRIQTIIINGNSIQVSGKKTNFQPTHLNGPDYDGDGTGDNADTDDDNDGTIDTQDDFPLMQLEQKHR